MKKTVLSRVLLTIVSLLAIACSNDDAGQVNAQPATNQTTASGKTLVVYYSYTGNCQKIVGELTRQITADVVQIQPAEKGLRYEANGYALGTELLNAIQANPTDAASYPAIDPVSVSPRDYSNIIIVTPLWWSQMAAIMQTYLFNYGAQMAGKNIGLIVSSASSGISGVVADCKRLVPDGNYFSENLWIRSSQVGNAATLVSDWLKKINLNTNVAADNMKIRVYDGSRSVVFELNETSAAKSLYDQLPMNVTVENYGNNEKIFYPATTVSYGSDCIEGDCPAGTLALFSPWGNVVMYYGDASRYSGLYILGTAIEGADNIKDLTGSISVTAVSDALDVKAARTETTVNAQRAYTMSGAPAAAGQKGVIIRDGKKTVNRR